MDSQTLRKKFLKFFEGKGHKVVPSSSLIPENDTTVLLTTAGMQQFKPYFRGEKDPEVDFGSKNLTSVQKCFRTSDIDEVGDFSHDTFFEMLGNFSLGGYGKKEAIEYAWEIMTSPEWYGLDKDKFFATVFAGDEAIPADTESEKFWQDVAQGIEVKKFGREDNFWPSPVWVGTCGPSTELHYKFDDGSSVEVWNVVFTQYLHGEDDSYKDLGGVNVDTGMGFERLAMVSQNKKTIFETDLFWPIIQKVEELVSKKYGEDPSIDRKIRIIADHARAVSFLIADGVVPSNKEKGYVLRRLIRRALTHGRLLNEEFSGLEDLISVVKKEFSHQYPELNNLNLEVLRTEQEKFKNTLEAGLKEYQKISGDISGTEAFLLFSSFGFPLELIEELAKEDKKAVDTGAFEGLLREHQEKSRG